MSTETKFKLLLFFSFLCLTGLLIQGYFFWQIQAQLASQSQTQSNLPQSIEARLDAALAGSRYEPAHPTPFGLLNRPFSVDPFSQMQQQFDSLFGAFPMANGISLANTGLVAPAPELTLTETASEYQVAVATGDDIDVEINTELEANLLTVRGSLTQKISDSSSAVSSSFVSRSQFTRSFDLPKPVDEIGVFTESTSNGLLIHVPKKNPDDQRGQSNLRAGDR